MLNTALNYFHRKRAIAKALGCQGWTGRKKLSVLFDLARQVNQLEGDILEIGSAWGRSTVLLGYASSKQIWSIDPHTGGRAFIERCEFQDSFEIFKVNLATHGLSSRVKIIKQTTADVLAMKLLPETQHFALVFIDGLHTAAGVQIDFDLAFSRLVSGGFMVFDDYFEESVPDYAEKIDDLMKQCKQTVVKDADSGLLYYEKK